MTAGPSPARPVVGTDCTYPAKDGVRIEAFLAHPEGGGPYPGVVVLHARNGLQPFFKECAQQLAEEGLVGFSIGWQTRVPPNEQRILPPERTVVEDIAAGVDYLRSQSFVVGERLGIMGFCAGGTFVYLAVSLLEAFRSAVPHYGAVRRWRESTSVDPDGSLPQPYDLAERVTARLLIVAGEKDEAVPLEDVLAYRDRLQSMGKSVEVQVYPGVGHAFTIRGTRSYSEEAARDAWMRTISHFKATL